MSDEPGKARITDEQIALLKLGNAVKEIGLESLLLKLDESAINEITVELQSALTVLRTKLLTELLIVPLEDRQKWERLSREPILFQREFDKTIARFSTWMKRSYGVPVGSVGRPIKPEVAARDRKIFRWKESHKDWSFGRIGRKFQLDAKVTREAYVRYRKRQANETAKLLELLTDLLAETGFPGFVDSPPTTTDTIM